MANEALENKQRKLIFRSWHRGTREMDLLMGSFADQHVKGFDQAQADKYEEILEYSDPDLYNWYSKREEVPANLESDVLTLFLNHKFA